MPKATRRNPGRGRILVTVLLGVLGPAGVEAQRTGSVPVDGVDLVEQLAESLLLPTSRERLDRARELETEIRSLLAADPGDPGLRWAAISAMALQVDEETAAGKISVTRRIRSEVDILAEVAPDHPGYHHAMGRLHAGVLRINGVLRWLATRLVSDATLRNASWEEAERHFREAVAREPDAPHHRMELGILLMERGQVEEAEVEFGLVLGTPPRTLMEEQIQIRVRSILDDR